MGRATVIRSIRYNFLRVCTANPELYSGGGRKSTLCTTSMPAPAEYPLNERNSLRDLNTQFCKGRKDFNKLCSLSPNLTTRSLLPATTLKLQNPSLLRRQFSSSSPSTAVIGGIVQIELAQTGEGIADCELLRWFVQEGENVEEFQPLCEVQSDKASVEITSRYKGRVSQFKFTPGDIVKVGETLLELIIEGQNTPDMSVVDSSYNQSKEHASDSVTETPESGQRTQKNIQATPAVRNLAKISGVNLTDITGTGVGGRILKCDIENSMKDGTGPEGLNLESDSSEELEGQVAGRRKVLAEDDPIGDTYSVYVKPVIKDLSGSDKIIPIRGFRRIMAKTMAAAVAVPHFHYTEDINVNALVALKDNLKNGPLEQGIKLTYLPFLLKALSLALQKYPIMNSTVNEDVSEIAVRASHNIGVGMATSSGLVVPNIKNVQQLSILEIAEELSRLTQLAATNKLSNEDVTGGTITVSNFGSIGGKYGSPVLNLPEVAIVAIGKIQKLPRFAEDGGVYPASIMGVTWGADHRVVDGATVASFCNQWKNLIEQPTRFLLNMR